MADQHKNTQTLEFGHQAAQIKNTVTVNKIQLGEPQLIQQIIKELQIKIDGYQKDSAQN